MAILVSSKGYEATQDSCKYGDFAKAFLDRYKREFGFVIEKRSIIVDDIIVRGTAKSQVPLIKEAPLATNPPHLEKVCNLLFHSTLEGLFLDLLRTLVVGKPSFHSIRCKKW